MTDPHTLPPLSFAPLEGITGWIFRQVHHAMFPGLSRYYTPFFAPTADSPLTGRGLRDMHPDHNRGVPVVPQLLTNRAEDFIASARLLQDLGYKEVNLNLGCPSGTVVAKKKGAGFLSQPQALALNPAVKFLLLIPIGAVPVPLHHPFRQQKGHTGILRGKAHVCGICPTRQPHRQNPVTAEEIGVRREHPGIVAGHLKPQGVEQPVIQRVQFRAHTALAAPNNFIIQMGQLQG